jgi:hypothetical protein
MASQSADEPATGADDESVTASNGEQQLEPTPSGDADPAKAARAARVAEERNPGRGGGGDAPSNA